MGTVRDWGTVEDVIASRRVLGHLCTSNKFKNSFLLCVIVSLTVPMCHCHCWTNSVNTMKPKSWEHCNSYEMVSAADIDRPIHEMTCACGLSYWPQLCSVTSCETGTRASSHLDSVRCEKVKWPYSGWSLSRVFISFSRQLHFRIEEEKPRFTTLHLTEQINLKTHFSSVLHNYL